MNNKINLIVENLKSLTLVEISQLIKEIEITFNVSTLSYNTTLQNSTTIKDVIEPEQKIEEEKTIFSIILNEFPVEKKISILKIVRNITGLGLKESKELIDNVPKTLKEGLTKTECEQIKTELENIGAKILIK